MTRYLHRTIRTLACAGLTVATVLPFEGHATSTVLPGWDLFETLPGNTVFNGMNWTGVPLGSYTFPGGPAGPQNVGTTDTIVQRKGTADGPSETIPIEMVGLQLQGVQDDSLFITLQSVHGGPASGGTMTIDFDPEGNPHGAFSSTIDVYFDVRMGGLSGSIVQSAMLTLTSSGTSWSHEVPDDLYRPVIDGVNHLLNGNDILNDFWPVPLIEQHPDGASHGVKGAEHMPDGGSTLTLLFVGLAFLGSTRLRGVNGSPGRS